MTYMKAKLTEGPIGRLILRLTVPMIFGMLGMVFFNIIDTFYVGLMGTIPLAALTFTLPMVMVVGSLAIGIGVGASSNISRSIGERSHGKTVRFTTDSLVIAAFVGISITLIGLLTIDPLFRMLGASDEILPLIREYMSIWYIGCIFVVMPMVGNNAIRATGNTKVPSMIMMFGVVVNIILDPILIFGFGPVPAMGLSGAAIATVAARFAIFTASMWVLGMRYGMISLKMPSPDEFMESCRKILYVGIPAAGTRMIVPLSTGVLTGLLSVYGPAAVAAYGVASRIDFFAMSVLMALSTVMGPYVGQNHGARRNRRVAKGLFYAKWFSICWGSLMFLSLLLSGGFIGSFFSSDPDVLPVIALYFMIVPAGYALAGIFEVVNISLNALNKPVYASALSLLQMFILYVPLAYLGSLYFGLPGIFAAAPISYAVSSTLSQKVLERVLFEGGM